LPRYFTLRPNDFDIISMQQDDTALQVEVKLVCAIGSMMRVEVEVVADGSSEFIEIELTR
jgi:sulfate/thiosulfate transport system ATP-binding protein